MASLHAHLIQNHPDLLIKLQEEGKLTEWLTDQVKAVSATMAQLRKEGKPPYIIEEVCLDAMTSELPPSKFNCISEILFEEFENDYYRLKRTGILTYEILNMMEACAPVFEKIGFSEESCNDLVSRYAVKGTIRQYLKKEK